MTDRAYMQRAIRLARRGEGRVEPNPMVGCLIARDGQILGEGYHRTFGGPHAEIEALSDCRRAGHETDGATVYVTLEPCCHQGKTPPCTEALIEARPARVVVAMLDPAPHASGAGVDALRGASINVAVGTGEGGVRQLIDPYIKRVTTGMPWVIAKWAQTIDGHIATRNGDSRWISSAASRRFVHRLRGRVDAVMVGIGTVLADDPQLTARQVPIRRCARRVVIDPYLRIPEDARIFADRTTPITIAVGPDADPSHVVRLTRRESELFEMTTMPAGADLSPLLRHLALAHGATNVLVEGGSRLLGAMLAHRLIDQCLVFTAPLLLGDADAITAVRGMAVEQITSAPRMHLVGTRRFEGDLMLDYRCNG